MLIDAQDEFVDNSVRAGTHTFSPDPVEPVEKTKCTVRFPQWLRWLHTTMTCSLKIHGKAHDGTQAADSGFHKQDQKSSLQRWRNQAFNFDLNSFPPITAYKCTLPFSVTSNLDSATEIPSFSKANRGAAATSSKWFLNSPGASSSKVSLMNLIQ